MESISQNFTCAFTLTRSRLELLPVSVFVYLILTELWPLIDVSISFHSISFNRVNGRNLTKFCICIDIDRIYVRIVT